MSDHAEAVETAKRVNASSPTWDDETLQLASAVLEMAGQPPDVVSCRLALNISKVLDELASVIDIAAEGPRLEMMKHVDAISAISNCRAMPGAKAEATTCPAR